MSTPEIKRDLIEIKEQFVRALKKARDENNPLAALAAQREKNKKLEEILERIRFLETLDDTDKGSKP
jgi:hypothetical protein